MPTASIRCRRICTAALLAAVGAATGLGWSEEGRAAQLATAGLHWPARAGDGAMAGVAALSPLFAGLALLLLLLLLWGPAARSGGRRRPPRRAAVPPPAPPALPTGDAAPPKLSRAGGLAAHHVGAAVDLLSAAAARGDLAAAQDRAGKAADAAAAPAEPPAQAAPQALALRRLVASPEDMLPRSLPELEREIASLLHQLRDR